MLDYDFKILCKHMLLKALATVPHMWHVLKKLHLTVQNIVMEFINLRTAVGIHRSLCRQQELHLISTLFFPTFSGELLLCKQTWIWWLLETVFEQANTEPWWLNGLFRKPNWLPPVKVSMYLISWSNSNCLQYNCSCIYAVNQDS